ncbi:hypothetical protein Scep_017232 [Stephania cephalantha]|uniref:Uncharacterized protein n=1 Tax=Stephania cephalantha TaxID=152367 RepID=A0AAP0NUU1_9MAGN
MTKIFKQGMITEGYCWKSVPDHQKEIYRERWKDPSIDEAIVRVAYDAKACVRYGALMHELRTLGVRPDFVTDEAWNRYRDYWASADFRARSDNASHNRKSEKGGLALDKDEDDEVTPNDVFLHVHMKDHDGVTFIDSRSTRFHLTKLVRRRKEHTQATPDQPIEKEQLYYDAAGSAQRGVFMGSDHLPGRRGDMQIPVLARPKSRWCGVQSLMQLFRGLCNLRLSCRVNWECAWALVRTPLRHHHRHHLKSIIGRLGWIRLVHHSSNTTMTIETTRNGWSRSTLVTKVSTPKESFEGDAGHWRRLTAGFIA